MGGGANIYAAQNNIQVLPADDLISGEHSDIIKTCYNAVQIELVLFMLIT